MHSPIPNENANGQFLFLLSYVSASGIGLFFMISGALLLPIQLDIMSFLKKRFVKVALPAIFWSLFYLGANFLIYSRPIWGKK